MHDDLIFPAQEIIELARDLCDGKHGELNEKQHSLICSFPMIAENFMQVVVNWSDWITEMKMRRAFYGIGHETKTPLTAIKSSSQILLQELSFIGPLSSEQKIIIEKIYQNAAMLYDTMTDLLDLSTYPKMDE